ncbi:nitrate/nitrite transporter NrtS [Roseivirga sp. E12]|uniref:nitrate/nitrite transporter NrtS n=1 Tax=Roseivirga sp. E12 TaxID=2819237 RepID=UPI001ABBF099|nr:nitrate/nitrite transporter NrtS [Roseivirga sp. E12]MBO3698852.1 nitrate/nitrite transporter NrtS [Roseivirga sp. E12]
MKVNSNNSFLAAFSDRRNIILAIKMSLVVGTLLNCINQAECFINQDFDQLNVPKLLFTYSVPFFVSIYSSTIAKLKG